MSINTYLEKMGSELVLSESEKSSIKTSIDNINNKIDIYFSAIEEKKIFGSYDRGTILPRKVDDNSDIDIMIVFENTNKYKPQTFLDRLRRFAEQYYRTSEIYQSSPSLVLELNHIKFEITPAYLDWGIYYIPDDPSNWKSTNPDEFSNSLYECNKNNGYKIKPVIRLIKYWNICNNNRNLTSYKLEKEISEKLKYSYFSCNSYSDYILKALNELRYLEGAGKVSMAISQIKKALEYEQEGMPYTALVEIKKVFPEI